MEIEIQLKERVHELTAKKKKLLTAMKRAKRTIVKSKVAKAEVDKELKKLSALAKMSPEDARKAVLAEMDGVKPEHIYPKDLERDFERIDKKSKKVKPAAERDVLDLAIEDDDDGPSAGGGGSAVHVGDDEGRTMATATVARGTSADDYEEDEVIDLSNE